MKFESNLNKAGKKMKRIISITSIIILFSLILQADTTISNNDIGFTINLPVNWVYTRISDSTVIFNDTSLTYQSQITIKKFHRNSSDYPTPDDWTRAHFIAYLMVTNYSYDPFGAVLYYDSTATCKQNSFWATEAFSEFYPLDTVLGAWNEFIRFTSTGDYGYSLYAIGDTSDMKVHIGMYAAMIQSIELTDQSATSVFKVIPSKKIKIASENSAMKIGIFDLLGKRRLSTALSHSVTIHSQPGLTLKRINLK